MPEKKAPRYKSMRTLLKAFVERRIDHDEYLAQSERLRRPPKEKRKP